MKHALILSLLAAGCATVPVADTNSYEELQSCPSQMTESQARSGIVRCTALCSSYARDFASFGLDCKCYCGGPGGRKFQGGLVPSPNASQM